ncbi:hypothetical protein ACX12M_17260 [Cellulosimicrobium cellulans]
MNPWMWILWALVALVVFFVGTAAVAAAVEGMRKRKPCERCGHVAGKGGAR